MDKCPGFNSKIAYYTKNLGFLKLKTQMTEILEIANKDFKTTKNIFVKTLQ